MVTHRELDSWLALFTIGSNATYNDFLAMLNLRNSSSFKDLTDSKASRFSKLNPAAGEKPIIFALK